MRWPVIILLFNLLVNITTYGASVPEYCKKVQPYRYCYKGEFVTNEQTDGLVQDTFTLISESTEDQYLKEWEKLALESIINRRNSGLNIFPEAKEKVSLLNARTCKGALNEITENSKRKQKTRSSKPKNKNPMTETDFFARHIQMALISGPWFKKTKELHVKIQKEKLGELKKARDDCIKEQESTNSQMKSMSICQEMEKNNLGVFGDIHYRYQEKANQYFKPLIQLKNSYPALFKQEGIFTIVEKAGDLANKMLSKIPSVLKSKIIKKSEKIYNSHIGKIDSGDIGSTIDFLSPLRELSNEETDQIKGFAEEFRKDKELRELAVNAIATDAKDIDNSLKHFCDKNYLTGSDKDPQLQHYTSLVDEFLNRQVAKANKGEISKEELDSQIKLSRDVQCHLIQKYPGDANVSGAAIGGLTLLGSGVLAWATGGSSLLVQGLFLTAGTVLGGVGVKDYIDSIDRYHIGKVVVGNEWANYTEFQKVHDDLKNTRDINFALNIGLLPLSVFDVAAVRSSYRAIKNLGKVLDTKKVSLGNTPLKASLTLNEMNQLGKILPHMSKTEIEELFRVISPMDRFKRAQYIAKLELPKTSIPKQVAQTEESAKSNAPQLVENKNDQKAKKQQNFSQLMFNHTIVDHANDPELQRIGQKLQEQGVKGARNPQKKYDAWLIELEDLYQNNPEELKKILESRYLEPSIMKYEDIPEKYFKGLEEQARRRGAGNAQIDRAGYYEAIKTDQAASIKNWIDYLSSSETKHYPMWAKLWALKAVTKMGKYSDESKMFGRRRKTEVASFAELNRESLAEVMDVIIKAKNGEEVDEFFKPFLKDLSFSNLYSASYAKKLAEIADTSSIEGKWVKYDQGSNCGPLVSALEGKGTNWCTANPGIAKKHLAGGDFHVFFTKDKSGEYAQPRVAIRMEGERISEIRGIEKGQHLDRHVAEAGVVSNKMKEFGEEGVQYAKREEQLKILNRIEDKTEAGEELTKEELRFLYELDHKIEDFGYGRDPRIDEIIGKRKIKEDLIKATGFKESEISVTAEEALKGGVKYHYGDLNLRSLTDAKDLKLPESIGGDLSLRSLTDAKDLKLPESIGGDLSLRSLRDAKGLKLPNSIGGHLNLDSLTDAKDLKLPNSIGGDLYLNSLTDAKDLKLPESIGGDLYLNSLTDAKDLKLPESIGGDLYLNSLTDAKDLKLPESIGGDLSLRSLRDAKGLKLPNSIGGHLNLDSLTDAKDLKLPNSIGGHLNLRSLTDAKGLKLPNSIGGGLNLRSLTDAKDLKLPESIGGDLSLRSLRDAKDLKLPNSIGGDLSLRSLTDAKDLKLPNSIGGDLYLNSLTDAKDLKFPNSIGGDLYLDSLTDAKGLKFSESIGGDLYLNSLTDAKDLKLPNSIGGHLDLRSLTDAKGLKLPNSIGGGLYLDSLTDAKDLKLPNSIGGHLDLRSLTDAKGLKLPNSIGGGLYLDSLTDAKGLKFPNSIGGHLYLNSLTDAKDLKLPNSIGGDLYLDSLTDAKGLKFSESIGGHLNLRSLTDAKDLKLPNSIGGELNLDSLTDAKDLKLPNSIGGGLYLDSLTDAKDLKLPNSIGGDLYLDSLTDAKGLKFSESIGGDLYLNSLTDAKDLKLPNSIGGHLDLRSLTDAKGLKVSNGVKQIILPENMRGFIPEGYNGKIIYKD